MTTLKTGDHAPDFQLHRDGNGMVKLSDYIGRKIVLFFYPKDDTSGCTAEAIDFSSLKQEFEAAGTSVLGMSPDSVRKHDKFKQKHDLSVPLLSDEEKTTLNKYGVWVEKSMYGRKYMGVERSTFLIGPDGKIIRAWRKVTVPGHAQEVLEAARIA